jgi:transcriptional regulator with GAF, ATPase, and Fis domain
VIENDCPPEETSELQAGKGLTYAPPRRMVGQEDETERLRRERNLYRRLLDLGDQEELEPFLREALSLIVEAVDVEHGYLALYDDGGGAGWWIAHGLSAEQVDGVRHVISRGIIAQAVATGQTIVTPSAQSDPRFNRLDSVKLRGIEAVLCTPIGTAPPRGVLYLQGQRRPDFFGDEDRGIAETFARHLAPLADLVVSRQRVRTSDDPTRAVRKKLRLEGVIGRSAALAAVLEQVSFVAALDVSVLLTGDSGTGKSQLARVIHENGPRASHPFVALNCATLPETLIESELFGALPGAHSTASRKIEGKVAGADRGTLFLDEVGELSAPAQAKLLQLLHSKEYYPLGGTKPVRADIRLIAATNLDLERAVAEHKFREDLYYRLHVLPVRLPSLAERREDIALLATHFSADASRRHGLPQCPLSPNALRALELADWPGNARQLAHVVEAALIRATGERAAQIETAHLFPNGKPAATPGGADGETLQEATRRFQAEHLRKALEANGWNVIETARRLDLARSQVYKLIHAYGLERGKK